MKIRYKGESDISLTKNKKYRVISIEDAISILKNPDKIGNIVEGKIGKSQRFIKYGMTAWQVFRYITLPQAIKNGLPLFKNQFVITLQKTSIVGYIAIQDLTRASSIVTSRTFDAVFGLISVSVLYLVIGKIGTLVLNVFSREKHIGGKDDE